VWATSNAGVCGCVAGSLPRSSIADSTTPKAAAAQSIASVICSTSQALACIGRPPSRRPATAGVPAIRSMPPEARER
jgi:hypothetical protein